MSDSFSFFDFALHHLVQICCEIHIASSRVVIGGSFLGLRHLRCDTNHLRSSDA